VERDEGAAHPFELTGGHAEVECFDCHGEPGFMQAGSGCSDCHDRTHEFGSDKCAECHSPADGWQSVGAGEQHPFPQDHGGTVLSCAMCHPGSDLTAYSCVTCHSEIQMAQIHDAKGLAEVAGACVRCHPQGEKR